jgi:threonine/homoserine/homoserine lactone efflux protein
MPAFDPLYVSYLSLTFALVITPGATTAVVVRNTLDAGWRGGLWAAVGAALGNSAHAAIAGLGLAVVLTRSPGLFTALKIAGGCYLLWLALKSARRLFHHEALPASQTILAATRTPHAHHAWREGLSVNLLNPAIATFYLAVVPAFVPTDAPVNHYVWLAATHVGMAFVVHSLWAIALDRLRHVLTRPSARLALEGITAVALGVLAARVLWTAVRTPG